MEEIIEYAIELLKPMSREFETLEYMYWVTVSEPHSRISNQNMSQHQSMEEYCEACIARAVEDKQKEWIVERNVLMGKIYEAENKGYYIYYCVKTGKDKKAHYVKNKIKVSPNHILSLKKELKTDFRVNTKFSYDYIRLISHETEGFRHCESCGKMFETCLLLDEQELEHWEDEVDFKNLSESEAYQLDKILHCFFWGDEEFKDRLEALAQRVIKACASSDI